MPHAAHRIASRRAQAERIVPGPATDNFHGHDLVCRLHPAGEDPALAAAAEKRFQHNARNFDFRVVLGQPGIFGQRAHEIAAIGQRRGPRSRPMRNDFGWPRERNVGRIGVGQIADESRE